MSPRTGRPPVDNPRRNAIHVRLTDDELTLVKAAAEKTGTTVGEFVRARALAAAKRVR